jgi:tetratricopeptide (TPR) repeat protein
VTKLEMEPLELEVRRDGDSAQIEVYDAPSLFEEGGQEMDADRYAEAAASYERLIQNFPDSPYVPPALFNAGLSYEGLGRFADAAERYRRVSDGLGSGKVAKDAVMRLGACYAELNRWPASIEVFEQALKRQDLNLSERIEAMSRRGLGLFEIGDSQVAEATFRDTVAYYQAQKEVERIDSNFFVAMAQFYQAYIAHRRFRELPLRMPQKQLEQDMQTLARQFLTTQERYVETIRLKEPMWASAAGFHVGSLYRELYDALVKTPLPPEIDNELKKLIYGEMLKGNLRTLLEKARGILQKNLEMAERVGVKNGWIEKSSEQMEEISKLLVALDDQPIGPDAVTPPGERQPPVPTVPAIPTHTKSRFRSHDPIPPTSTPL